MRAEKAPWRAKRAGQPPRGWARQTELEEYRALTLGRIASLVEVREPFVLVSQVQRSGGTLVTRLFDGHPEVHVRHGDMEIGYPRKSNWPRIPLEEGPERWFEILYEEKNHKGVRQLLRGEETPAESYYPRWFLPRLQKAIFDHCVQAWDVTTARGVLDAYFTSYFNAWLDNRNLYTGPKKAVLGFAPKMNADAEGLEGSSPRTPTARSSRSSATRAPGLHLRSSTSRSSRRSTARSSRGSARPRRRSPQESAMATASSSSPTTSSCWTRRGRPRASPTGSGSRNRRCSSRRRSTGKRARELVASGRGRGHPRRPHRALPRAPRRGHDRTDRAAVRRRVRSEPWRRATSSSRA